MDKIKLFLERGFFPVQLPPAFTTELFAKKYKRLQATWDAHPKVPRSNPERFSVARSSYNRRVTSILNPVAYYFLSKSIATYWSRIQNHFSGSRFSYSRPKLERGLRAIKINRFSDVHDHKILSAAGFRFALITDISRFFPTIYTHSIPWALHGKNVAKVQRGKSPMYFGNILDANSMAVQDFQTMGLPVGPDTSHVIAEIIGTAIDKELKREFGEWPNGFRYVDDFYLFFNDREKAERALSIISRIAAGYELQLNAQKTRIIETKELIEESWKYKLKGAAIAEDRHKQRNDLHKFFETLLTLEKDYRDESVVKYGLKIASSTIIKKSNWKIFEAYLLHCGFAFPNTLQIIASLLATYARYEYPLNLSAIARFCNATIATHAPSDNHSEVAWALWIMVELDLTLEKEAVQALDEISSSACLLLALTVLHSKPTAHEISPNKLAAFANPEALYSDAWLLAYEAGRRNWLKNTNHTHISNEKYFGQLLANNIFFFDETARLPPIFVAKNAAEFNDSLFESDIELGDLFDFDEADEEYFDNEDQHENKETEDDETVEDDNEPKENDEGNEKDWFI